LNVLRTALHFLQRHRTDFQSLFQNLRWRLQNLFEKKHLLQETSFARQETFFVKPFAIFVKLFTKIVFDER
jgi:hypothetical protein